MTVEILAPITEGARCASCNNQTDDVRRLSVGDVVQRQSIHLCGRCRESLRVQLGKASVDTVAGFKPATFTPADPPVDVDANVKGLQELQAELTGKDVQHGAGQQS